MAKRFTESKPAGRVYKTEEDWKAIFREIDRLPVGKFYKYVGAEGTPMAMRSSIANRRGMWPRGKKINMRIAGGVLYIRTVENDEVTVRSGQFAEAGEAP